MTGEQDDFLHIKQDERSCYNRVRSSNKNQEWSNEYHLFLDELRNFETILRSQGRFKILISLLPRMLSRKTQDP